MRGAALRSLLASVAVLALLLPPATRAADQPNPPGVPHAPGTPSAPGATSRTPVLFSADEVQDEQSLGLVVAKGHVELSQGEQIVLADTVAYNEHTDTVTASGHVSLLQPTGDIVFADYVELHNDMRDGFIKDVRILLSDRSRLAANTGRRVNANVIEMRRGVYSPCALCASDPTKPPVWQIKAAQVTDDRQRQVVSYRDAVMEIDGLPIFYTPYFSHPDPSVTRQSGFLPPTFGFGSTLGAHTSIPYYWVLGPDKDLTVRPILTTRAGEVLDGEYRQRFGNGQMQIQGSVAADSPYQNPLPDSTQPITRETRWNIMGSGEFDVTNNWRLGFDVQRESDLSYMLLYNFPQPENFLTTHLYAENFGTNSYANISAFAFQSLNPLIGDGREPIVGPVADYDWTSQPDRYGGRIDIKDNLLNLAEPRGVATRRISLGEDYRVPFTGPIGDRYDFLVSLRTDGYNSDNVQIGPSESSLYSETTGRVFPQAELKWRYPWVRSGPSGNALIEPIAAVIVGPNGGNPLGIPNNDSQGFEFDDSSLFVPDRLPGYDLVDSGQRVDYGLHGEFNTKSLGHWETLVGQSYRFEQQSPFQPGSGLTDRASDVVGRVVLSTGHLVDFLYRFRLNHTDLAMERQEAGIEVGPKSLRVNLSFISIAPIPGITPIPGTTGIPGSVETVNGAPITGDQIGASISAQLSRYWSLGLNDTRNVAGGGGNTIYSGATLTYRDDCFAVVTSLQQSGISVANIRPGVSMMVTFVFKNLGDAGARLFSVSGS